MTTSNSPQWSSSSKRLVILVLLGLAFLAIYRVRALLLPLIMAMILAFLISPLVQLITRRTPLSRNWSIASVYLLLITALISIPISTITPVVVQANNLIQNTPVYLSQLGELFQEPIVLIEGIEIPVDQLSLDQAFASLSNNLIQIIQTLGGQTLSLFSSLATATISTVGWTVLVLFLSFYLVKDYQLIFDAIINVVSPAYQDDIRALGQEIGFTWHAFLRGQLVLCVAVGGIFFVIAIIIGLPFAIILAVIAGIMELIPTFGPILAAVPAVLVALFQANNSWVGRSMSPFWFGVLVLAIYGFIYQFENYYLVPRIIGKHLKLHPLVIVIGVLAGASVAGILGILLAAPVLATAVLIFKYIYRKLTDQLPFPEKEPPEIIATDKDSFTKIKQLMRTNDEQY